MSSEKITEKNNVGIFMEVTRCDTFYKRELGSSDLTVSPDEIKKITGGDGFYARSDTDIEWTPILTSFDTSDWKGGIGLSFTREQVINLPIVTHKNGLLNDNRKENLTIPSLSSIKGKRIACFDYDSDEEEFPQHATVG